MPPKRPTDTVDADCIDDRTHAEKEHALFHQERLKEFRALKAESTVISKSKEPNSKSKVNTVEQISSKRNQEKYRLLCNEYEKLAMRNREQDREIEMLRTRVKRLEEHSRKLISEKEELEGEFRVLRRKEEEEEERI